MPKEKPSLAFRLLQQLITDFGENIFSTDRKILCKVCEIKLAKEKRFSVVQHINTILSHNSPSDIFLINVKEFDQINHNTISKAFDG